MTVTNTIAEADRVVASVKSLYEKEVDNIITLSLVWFGMTIIFQMV